MVTNQIMQNHTKPNRNIAKLNHTKLDNTKIGITKNFFEVTSYKLEILHVNISKTI